MRLKGIISPTGQEIREYDSLGGGYFRARRGEKALHRGLDFKCDPGQVIIMPVAPGGVLIRKAYPYSDSKEYAGVVIDADFAIIKLFYIDPYMEYIGKRMLVRQPIGTAQDISKRYSPLMTPHVHMEVILNSREYVRGGGLYINPKLLLI